MKQGIIAVFLFGYSILCASQIQPVIATNFPDPTVIYTNGKYYAYATNTVRQGRSIHIQVAVSGNLKEWKIIGDALPKKPDWGNTDFWAPHVIYNKHIGKYVLFYSAETIDAKIGKAIGVAFSDKPEGPFVDKGTPLITDSGFRAIDPMVLEDPRSHKYFMVWGSDFHPLKIRELNRLMTAFANGSKTSNIIYPEKNKANEKLIEGSWIDYNDGYYYLYYSGNNCCGPDANYAVLIARSKNITGPYERLGQFNGKGNSIILGKNDVITAPGHNSIIKDQNGQKWIAYHAIPNDHFKNKIYDRLMYMNKIKYKNGWPVVLSDERNKISWNDTAVVFHKNDNKSGAQYPRLLQLNNDRWLAAYTVLNNDGYKKQKDGGLSLEIAQSTDNGKTWNKWSAIADKGRDLDNAQMILLPDHSILLAGRSVRWHESYRLPVYKSKDGGKTWKHLSTIDANEGATGTLGNPDKGVYEPHFYFLKDGRLAVMYANEKHVIETPAYSQVVSQKISPDYGKTWGKEIWVVNEQGHNQSRPGMPVVTKMKNDKYMVVYEICGPEDCGIYYKISNDGMEWEKGLGTFIPDQKAAPYILSLANGILVLTSNGGNISMSNDFGKKWQTGARAWQHTKRFEEDWHQTIWQSIYQFGDDRIGIATSLKNSAGGYDIKIRFGDMQEIE